MQQDNEKISNLIQIAKEKIDNVESLPVNSLINSTFLKTPESEPISRQRYSPRHAICVVDSCKHDHCTIHGLIGSSDFHEEIMHGRVWGPTIIDPGYRFFNMLFGNRIIEPIIEFLFTGPTLREAYFHFLPDVSLPRAPSLSALRHDIPLLKARLPGFLPNQVSAEQLYERSKSPSLLFEFASKHCVLLCAHMNKTPPDFATLHVESGSGYVVYSWRI